MFKKSLVMICLFVICHSMTSHAMDIQTQVERQQMFNFNQEVTALIAEAQQAERKFVVRPKLENKKTEIQDYIVDCEDQAAKQYGLQLIQQLDQALVRPASKSKNRFHNAKNDIHVGKINPTLVSMLLLEIGSSGEQ